MSRCSILSRGDLRGFPLDTPFVSFLVKGKIPRCGARSSTKGRFAEILVRSKVSNFSLLPHNKVTSNFLLCGVTHALPRLLSCVKKVGKDTQGTFWFLDLRQRESPAPFQLPRRRIELVEILMGNDCKVCLSVKLKHCPAPFQLSRRRIELVEILMGNDCKICFPVKLKHCPASFRLPQ